MDISCPSVHSVVGFVCLKVDYASSSAGAGGKAIFVPCHVKRDLTGRARRSHCSARQAWCTRSASKLAQLETSPEDAMGEAAPSRCKPDQS